MKNEDNEIEQVRTDLVLPPDASLALVAERLVEQARHDQVSLTGEGGLEWVLFFAVVRLRFWWCSSWFGSDARFLVKQRAVLAEFLLSRRATFF